MIPPHCPHSPPAVLPFMALRGSGKESVYIQLRNFIIFSDFAPSHRLKERDLAEDFGISRAPLREVLQLLCHQGLLVVRPRQGIMLAPIAEEQLRHIFEVRLPLEREVARLAALRATSEDINRIFVLAERSEEMHAHRSIEAIIRNDAAFHTALARAAKNPVLYRSRESAHNICLRYCFLMRWRHKVDPEGGKGHMELAKAVEAGESERAAQLHADHVNTFTRLLN